MAPLSILFGAALIALGMIGYFEPGTLGDYDPDKSRFTSLTPAAIGAVLLLCGLLVLAKPTARKHAMHLAALAGVIGFAGGFMPLFRSEFDFRKASAISGLIMITLSLMFVILCVKSFIDARKARQQTPVG